MMEQNAHLERHEKLCLHALLPIILHEMLSRKVPEVDLQTYMHLAQFIRTQAK